MKGLIRLTLRILILVQFRLITLFNINTKTNGYKNKDLLYVVKHTHGTFYEKIYVRMAKYC